MIRKMLSAMRRRGMYPVSVMWMPALERTQAVSYLIFIIVLLIVGCTPLIPATTPPQLEYTPGAFVSIDDDIFDAGFFTVNYPDGWRVVKSSVASAPLEVVFASPDNSMTIHIVDGVAPYPESTLEPDVHDRRQNLELSTHVMLTVIGRSQIDDAAAFDTIFDAVFASVMLTK